MKASSGGAGEDRSRTAVVLVQGESFAVVGGRMSGAYGLPRRSQQIVRPPVVVSVLRGRSLSITSFSDPYDYPAHGQFDPLTGTLIRALAATGEAVR